MYGGVATPLVYLQQNVCNNQDPSTSQTHHVDSYGVQINFQNNRNTRCGYRKQQDSAETEALLPSMTITTGRSRGWWRAGLRN